jgi:predicted NAD/FAD-binding protein
MPVRNVEEDLEYAALMTNRQFHALCTKLDEKRLIQELKDLVPLRKIKKRKNYER